jgi:hypothetical protein
LNKLKRFSVVLAFALFTLAPNANGIQGNNGDNNNNNNNNSSDGGGTNNNGQNNDTCGSAQYNGNGGNSGGDGDSIPLYGGLSILLAGAAIFGIRKLRKK